MKQSSLKNRPHGLSSTMMVLCLALGASGAGTAFAALQTITTGANFDVSYDDALLGLFGAPSVSGPTISFTPTNFLAQSLNGVGTVPANSTINLMLTAKNGFSFGSLALVERGDYRLNGIGSSVSVGGQLAAFDQADPINSYSFSFITPSPATPLTTNSNALAPWIASTALNVSQAPFFQPSKLNVTLQNVLTATTTAQGGLGSEAFIQKKFAGSPVVTLEVLAAPLPAAGWLVVAGALPLLRLVRRGT